MRSLVAAGCSSRSSGVSHISQLRVVPPALEPAETPPSQSKQESVYSSLESFPGEVRRAFLGACDSRLSSAEPRCYERTVHWEEQCLALGMPAACSEPWDKVLFVFPCSSGCCALGSPARLFMALMQKITMAVIASGLLIVRLPRLPGQKP